MNPVVEEALSNLISRVNSNEEEIKKLQGSVTTYKKGNKQGLASDGQLKYIRILGGTTWDGMTKAEAGKEIDKLLKEKDSVQTVEPMIIDKKLTKKQLDELNEVSLL